MRCPHCGSPVRIRGNSWECGWCGDFGRLRSGVSRPAAEEESAPKNQLPVPAPPSFVSTPPSHDPTPPSHGPTPHPDDPTPPSHDPVTSPHDPVFATPDPHLTPTSPTQNPRCTPVKWGLIPLILLVIFGAVVAFFAWSNASHYRRAEDFLQEYDFQNAYNCLGKVP